METIANQPNFELLEIVSELEIHFKKYQPLTPSKTGDVVPDLSFINDFQSWQQFFKGAETHNRLAVRQLLSKPLVLSFYSRHWKEQSLEFLNELNEINPEIRANGGNLVIVTDKRHPELEKLAWENNLTLNFYFDADNKLAKALGIYHNNSPVWERFSGIDVQVPLLASFVINPYRQVVFDHTNWNGEYHLQSGKLIEEVYQSSLQVNSRRSA